MKTCFVVMGFGKRMDYRTSKEVDLDLIYRRVIKDLFAEDEFSDYELVRADEISGSDIIDVSMYALLCGADLVIADITTANENALYELGVRHALRPYSTIIMKQESEKWEIPFDLSHSRILRYKDYGEELSDSEAENIKDNLRHYVRSSENQNIDSPFYTFLPEITPPVLGAGEFHRFLNRAKDTNITISSLVSEAEKYKADSNFIEAKRIWAKLHKLIPHNDYIVQQFALSCYKAGIPNETLSLQEALRIINKLDPGNSLDLETIAITAAIYKKLFFVNKNYAYLDEAITFYRKGYVLKNDYYTGENYANCLLFKARQEGLPPDQQRYLEHGSQEVYREIIEIINNSLTEGEVNPWMYATLSISYCGIGESEKSAKYKKMFIESTSEKWQIETFEDNYQKLFS